MTLSSDSIRYAYELFEASQTSLLKKRDIERAEIRRNLHDIDDAAQYAGYPGVLQPEIDFAVELSRAKKNALCKAYEWDGIDLTEAIIRTIETEATQLLQQSMAGLVSGESGRMALKATRTHNVHTASSVKLGELSRHVQQTINEAQREMHNELILRMLESKKANSKRSTSMKVSDLSSKIENFRTALIEHADLWKQSLDHMLPDYPIANGSKLREQQDNLARQLGMLRPYIDKFDFPSAMSMAGVEWDIYDSAVSNDVAIRKGHSIEGVLQQLQKILGRLDAMNADSGIELSQRDVQTAAQNITIHQHGAQSRVNLNSTDNSQNVLSLSEQKVFSEVRKALQQGVPNGDELQKVLARLDEFESAVHKPTCLEKFQAFINDAASYMTLLAPFMPALAAMLSK